MRRVKIRNNIDSEYLKHYMMTMGSIFFEYNTMENVFRVGVKIDYASLVVLGIVFLGPTNEKE
jgi:hypothetical protein